MKSLEEFGNFSSDIPVNHAARIFERHFGYLYDSGTVKSFGCCYAYLFICQFFRLSPIAETLRLSICLS